MKLIICFFFSFFMFSASRCISQTPSIDSLMNLLKTDKEDTTRLMHLYNLCDEYEIIENYNEGLKYGLQALDLAKKLTGKSLDEKSKQFIEKYRAKIYTNIGIIQTGLGNYPEAIKNHFASLKIKELLDDKKGVSGCYNNIGGVYLEQNNFSEALKNYFASIKVKELIGDRKGISNTYSNIGNVYYEQENYNEALKYYTNALKIREEFGDSLKIANSYNDIAGVYYANQDYDNAFKTMMRSLKIKEKIGNKARIANDYGNIGNILQSQKKYVEARKYYANSIKISKEIGHKSYLKSAYKSLSELDNTLKNYKGAYENHKLYILYRDSLDNEETRKKTIQSQMTYDFEKKEAVVNAEHKKELESQEAISNEKSRRQKVIIAFVVFGLLLVLIFAGFIFRSLRITRKQKDIIEYQKNLVEQQKLEVEQQKSIVEEHQKEIIDSITYARRIQQSLLPTEKYIEKTINRLRKN